MIICEKCGGDTIGDSILDFCPKCDSNEEILRRAPYSLTTQLQGTIDGSEGVKLKADVDAGWYAEKGELLKWDDALKSCWLGAMDTAREALRICGRPEGYP